MLSASGAFTVKTTSESATAISGTYIAGNSHVLPSKNAYRLVAMSFQVDSVKQFLKKSKLEYFSNYWA